MPPEKKSRLPAARPAEGNPPFPTPSRVVVKGKLKLLLDMPLDVLYEIFSHLDPQSLLHVSYSSRALRSILTTKNSRAVWRSCIAADCDIPPKPEHMNEPQWSELLFGNTCSFCPLSSICALWVFSVRVCAGCLESKFLREATVRLVMNIPEREQLRGFWTLPSHQYAPGRKVYRHEDVQALVEAYRSIGTSDSAALKKFQDAQLARQRLAFEHTTQCDHYVQRVLPQRKKEEEAKFLRERLLQIEMRMRELGFSEEIDFIHAANSPVIANHPLVKSFDEITSTSWGPIVRTLKKMLNDIRPSMLEKKRKSLLKDRMQAVITALKVYVLSKPVPTAIDDAEQVYPSALDIVSLPTVHKMIFAEVNSYVTDAEPDLQRLKEYLSPETLDSLCEEWRTLKGRELVAMLPKRYRHLEDEDEDELYSLRFACVFFRCTTCGEPVNFPRVLAHSCTREARLGFRNLFGEEAWLWQRLDALPWNNDGARIEWDPLIAKAAISVIKSCDCDPRIVDQGDMDDDAAWLVCGTCECTGGNEREVFGWRRAIIHHLSHLNRGEDDPSWILLRDEEDIRLAKRAQEIWRDRDDIEARTDATSDHICVHCRERMSLSFVAHHFLNRHNKPKPLEGDDYRLHIDASMRGTRLRLLIPRRAQQATGSGTTGTQRKRKGSGKNQAKPAEIIIIDD
ncbi:hypothetical protein HDZ31DRAFT_39627 [Schizophyllum fasciatum]